jgi:hypothetical protein
MPAVRSREVPLFLPPCGRKALGPALGLLSLAGSLREAGYEPCIIQIACRQRREPHRVWHGVSFARCVANHE